MNKLLIIIDMQKDFIDGALGTKEAQSIVDNVVNKIDNFDGSIIATMDTHRDDYMETREGRFLPVPHCIKNTAGWEIDQSVMSALKRKGFKLVEKPTFGSVELPKLIKEKYNPEKLSVELVGLCTDICVVSNAMLLKAAFPEMDISIDSSCCAGVTPEKHEAALETMRSCQIEVK
ncbi:MAG: cysteine hydrolase [Ruminococcaceae bacterium]|nr:cysteine hydrolase [Oscillospiraceae bacterium]